MDDTSYTDLIMAMENETNSSIMNLTSGAIKERKNDALQQLQLPRATLKSWHRKLKHYRLCGEMADLQYGHYLRWIPLKDPGNLYITNGGILCDMKIINDIIHVTVKNNRNRLFEVKFNEAMIFQKLSDQERVILGVLDFLAK